MCIYACNLHLTCVVYISLTLFFSKKDNKSAIAPTDLFQKNIFFLILSLLKSNLTTNFSLTNAQYTLYSIYTQGLEAGIMQYIQYTVYTR